jgi:hypothetical protein
MVVIREGNPWMAGLRRHDGYGRQRVDFNVSWYKMGEECGGPCGQRF